MVKFNMQVACRNNHKNLVLFFTTIEKERSQRNVILFLSVSLNNTENIISCIFSETFTYKETGLVPDWPYERCLKELR